MRCHAPRTAAPVQAKADSSRLFAPARPLDIKQRPEGGRPAALPAGPGAGFSLVDVPVHAPPARAPDPAGIPEPLKAGVERLSGLAMDDVRVHRNSPEPARLGALAYTQGTDIHLGPGQEEHLPHEAWHVVQQMQGRVRATTQLRGLKLNDDCALEAEADRMGATAARPSGQGLDVHVHRPTPTNPPIQRLVRHQNKTLPPDGPYSPVVKHYSQAKIGLHVLKDTESPQDTRVHFLEWPKRYLIGEEHDVDGDLAGTSSWAKTAMGWTSVTKAREGQQLSVSQGPDLLKEGVSAVSEKRTNQEKQPKYDVGPQATLENVHEWQLAAVVQNIELLDDLSPENVKSDLKHQPKVLENNLHELIGNLIGLSREWYNDFIFAYEALVKLGEIQPSPELEEIYEFHKEFRDDYRQIIIDLMLEASLLCIIVEKKKKKYDMVKEDFKSPEEHAKNMQTYSSIFVYLLKDFSSLSKVTKKEHKKINRRLFGKGLFGHRGDTQDPLDKPENNLETTSPPRERAMIANLKAIPDEECPVLVQIGDAHVKNVKSGLGDKAVAVRLGTTLDDVTDYGKAPR